MRHRGLWMLVGAALLVAACGDDTGGAGGSTGEGGGSTTGGGGEDAATSTGSGGPAGPGLRATGELNGEPVELFCEPPSDLQIGKQFLYQQPGGAFDLWTARCRTEDLSVALWLDIANPEAGVTYTQPDAGDQINVALGDPMDIQPINRLAANLSEMHVTIDEVDPGSLTLVGSFSATWDDDGSGKFGFVEGTFDITGWE